MSNKKNNTNKQHRGVAIGKFLCYSLLFAILMSSCGPVNLLSRFKRTPREYSLNYCYSDVRAPKSRLSEETWIVFSDRENNPTYQNPGGKIVLKQMSFMEAFFVIREKGEFLQLVKYDPQLVEENPRARIIRNRKQAQYYGWVRKSNLLLTKQSSLDMATGFKNKAISMVVDSLAITQLQLVFDTDSILTYKDDVMTIPHCKIPVHEILYILKTSVDGKKYLVAKKTQLNPLEAETETLGWISTSIAKEMGQRLFVDGESLKDILLDTDDPTFLDQQCRDTLAIDAIESHETNLYINNNPSFRFAPVRSYQVDSLNTSFNTVFPAPLIDKSRAHVLNLNGNKIMYPEFLNLEKDLRKLNIIFVFEFRERVIQEYPSIMSVVQNLQSLLNIDDDPYQYKFGSVLSYRDNAQTTSHHLKSYGLTSSYFDMLDFLTAEMDSMSLYHPITDRQAWLGLRKAVEMMEEYPDETHLMIVIGESGFDSEKADSLLVKRIAKANGRILGYQIFNETLSNYDNNFVLQIENMIDNYARYDAPLRRERLVFTNQYKPEVHYRESMRNVYALDQQKAMTQGWVLFPAKSVEMQHDILALSIDTIFSEIRQDNDMVIECLYRAFDEFGDRYYRYAPSWSAYNEQDSLWLMNRELLHKMPTKLPAWYMQSIPLSVDNTDEADLDYHLLLSESELKEIIGFLEDITRYEPDYKYNGKRKNVKKCNCPDDYMTSEELQSNERKYDKDGNPVYLNTRKIRYHVYASYMNQLKSSYKIRTIKRHKLKYYSLANAELEIVGNPAKDLILHDYKIRDLKRKKYMKDVELDLLILYFKQKRATLENYIMHKNDKNSFVSNGESFYWIQRDLLP